MNPLGRLAAYGVVAYQRLFSPFIGRHCRFAPTCSEYARLSLIAHGLVRGSWLAMCRLLRCHPLHPGGYDPPPVARKSGSAPEREDRTEDQTWKSARRSRSA